MVQNENLQSLETGNHFIYICNMYLPNPFSCRGCEIRSIFMVNLRGLNFEFSFFKTGYHTTIKVISLPYYLYVAEGRIFIPRILVLCEMQTALCRFWKLISMSIFYEDNCWATRISINSCNFNVLRATL